NRIDAAVGDPRPQGVAVDGATQRRIDFADVATNKRDIVRQVVRTGLDGDPATTAARANRGGERRRRGGVDDIEPATGRLRGECRTLPGVGLDQGRTRGVPGRKPAATVGVGALEAITEHPGYLDVLRMRAHDAA